jgi:hypothetical protein
MLDTSTNLHLLSPQILHPHPRRQRQTIITYPPSFLPSRHLCTINPTLFAPHLPRLLTFLPGLILPLVDCGPTPTVGRPFPGSGRSRQGVFVFPPMQPPTETGHSCWARSSGRRFRLQPMTLRLNRRMLSYAISWVCDVRYLTSGYLFLTWFLLSQNWGGYSWHRRCWTRGSEG